MGAVTDKLDLRILKLLQKDALMTAEAIAAQVPLSPSAIARRLRRLRESGVIAGDVAVISEEVGPFLSAVVQVQMDRHALAAVEALRRRLIASPNVQLFLEVSGAFDLMLLVTVRDMDEYNAFTDTMLGDDPVVRRYESSFVKRRRKLSLALPLDTGED
ncbi:Lrp/AsnC family transcriptional regulator [Sphingomonas sp. DT-207]|uniref:Lrp/AsnC family transcriptional regulator n=1 Tax=Sphingomonas sp. DT-207 TaxID=3396167 RepID=UPI003F1D8E87